MDVAWTPERRSSRSGSQQQAMKEQFLSLPVSFLALFSTPGHSQDQDPSSLLQVTERRGAPAPLESLRAEARGISEPVATAIPSVGFGTATNGLPVLIGPGYRMALHEDGIAFHPALGPAAPVTQELAYELIDIRVGGVELLSAGGSAHLHLDGIRAQYEHPGGVYERYEATPAGVEQSFVFAERPMMNGDLVVRGRLTTNMQEVHDPGGGLAFELAGIGGVTIGAVPGLETHEASMAEEPAAVVGIDAEGNTSRGSIRFDGSHVEYVLPAAFVAKAAYPLVLDPLIGTDVQISMSSQREDRPDASASLCAWDVSFAADDYDVHAFQWGSPFLLAVRVTIGETSQAPAVGYVNHPRGHVIAWQEGPGPASALDIRARSIHLSGGVVIMSPDVLVAGSARDERNPALGGDSGPMLSSALLVYTDEGVGIQAIQLRPDVTSGPQIGSGILAFAGSAYTDPTITRSGGEPGRYLIAAERWYDSPAPGDHDIRYQTFDRNLTPISDPQEMTTVGQDEQAPSAAGDGTVFSLVWDLAQPTGSPLIPDRDILAAKIDLQGAVLDTQVVSGEVDVDTWHPSAVWTGSRTAVAWSEAAGGSTPKVCMTTLCNDTLEVCSPMECIDGPATHPPTPNYSPVLTSNADAFHDAPVERGSIYWTRGHIAITGSQSIYHQNYESYEPLSVTPLGGGCGDDFIITVAGPSAIGNANFSWIVEVEPLTTASMIVMNAKPNAGTPFSCGPCELQLDMGVIRAIPSSSGVFSTPIPGNPDLVGLEVTVQFFASPTIAMPCPALGSGFSASDRSRVTVTY